MSIELSEAEQERAREAIAGEKAAYRARLSGVRCTACDGSGQQLLTYKTRGGTRVGQTCPCTKCRPADHQAFLEALRSAPRAPALKG